VLSARQGQVLSRSRVSGVRRPPKKQDILSAIRYIDFAEHGAGRPGFCPIHSRIHSALEREGSWAEGPLIPGTWQPSEGVGGALSIGVMGISCAPAAKEDESGAKTTLSVYIWRDIQAHSSFSESQLT